MFQGTFEQALDALRTNRDLSSIHTFMKFMDVHKNTVGGWLLGTSEIPTGETKIRALSFFQLNGWFVTDYEKLDPLAKSLVLLLGYRVTTLPALLEEMGLSKNYGHGVLNYLYGGKELTKSSRKLAERYVADTVNELESVRAKLSEDFLIASGSRETVPAATLISDDPVTQLASLLRQACPLATWLNSDDFTDEQRAEMRKLVGPEEYVNLSVTLAQMKSARTRLQHRNG